jgi:ribosomal protein S18 acetylase RimI-like enzyme
LNLIRLERSHVKPATRMLARAFADDPLMRALAPDDHRRPLVLARCFACVLRLGLYYGEAYAVDRQLSGVAVWLPSSALGDTLWRRIRTGVVWIPLLCGWSFFRRIWGYHEHLLARWQAHAPQRFLYLQLLGVDPNCQGRGHARRLLEPMLARADADRLPCCLETSNEQNVEFYGRFGFTLLEKTVAPGNDVPCWLLKREPNATG